MSEDGSTGVVEAARAKFQNIAAAQDLLDADAVVSVVPLTTEQAIGQPTRRDFPIVEGKERVIEATFRGARAHAFTDSPRDFNGTLRDVLALDLSSNHNRAVFIAVLNAALRSLGMIDTSLHCRDDDPERCAKELADHIHGKWGQGTVGLIGLNPAIAEGLVGAFGADAVRITDLNPKNLGAEKFGVTVWDGKTQTEELVRQCNVVLITGTTLVNGTFDRILELTQGHGKDYILYGVTGAGVGELLGLNRMCPYGQAG